MVACQCYCRISYRNVHIWIVWNDISCINLHKTEDSACDLQITHCPRIEWYEKHRLWKIVIINLIYACFWDYIITVIYKFMYAYFRKHIATCIYKFNLYYSIKMHILAFSVNAIWEKLINLYIIVYLNSIYLLTSNSDLHYKPKFLLVN